MTHRGGEAMNNIPDHMPECDDFRSEALRRNRECICEALRACEQRSYSLGIALGAFATIGGT